MNTPDTTETSAAPDKPWHAQAICCGRDDGTYDFATRGDAELFRSQYTAGAGVAGPGLPGGHDRSVIITGPADQSEREAGTVLAEYLEAMRADKGMRGMVEECIALCVEVRANLTAEVLRADRAENARDQVGEMLHAAQEQRNQASARWHEERKHAAEAERERDRLSQLLEIARGELASARLRAEHIKRYTDWFTTAADTATPAHIVGALQYHTAQLLRLLGTGSAQDGPERHAGAPAAPATGAEPRQAGNGPQEPATPAQPEYVPGHPGKLAQRPDWLDKPERHRTPEEIRTYRLDHCGTCRDAEFYGWSGTAAEQAHAAHLETVDAGPLTGTPCRCPKCTQPPVCPGCELPETNCACG